MSQKTEKIKITQIVKVEHEKGKKVTGKSGGRESPTNWKPNKRHKVF